MILLARHDRSRTFPRCHSQTVSPSDFDLTLEDCWRGLESGIALGWVALPNIDQEPGLWDMVDIDEYSHLEHPLNADLHAVVPDKFVAFRRPRDLGPCTYSDTTGFRQFSPLHYLTLFRSLDVTGQIDIVEYAHFDDPLNADLHIVVPGKFVAFRGPFDLGSREYSDEDGYRKFSPKHYVRIFQDLGVTDIVRLTATSPSTSRVYDQADVVTNGIRHHDLCFDDCTPLRPASSPASSPSPTPSRASSRCTARRGSAARARSSRST
jgi:hypothetical protein